MQAYITVKMFNALDNKVRLTKQTSIISNNREHR